jgi:hypothetical protein
MSKRAQAKTSQAKTREFVGRIFTRKLDRDETPTLGVRHAQAEAITEVSELLCLGPVYFSSFGSDFAKAR